MGKAFFDGYDYMPKDQPNCGCSSCIDKKELEYFKLKVHCLEQQIISLNAIIDILRNCVTLNSNKNYNEEEIRHLARIDAE